VRSATVIVSALVHVLVFGYALRVSSQNKRRATSVAVVGEKKKPQEKKPEDKPKPPPKPKLASARPEPREAPAPSKAEAPPPPSDTPAPVDTGLTLDSGDAPGIVVPSKGAAQGGKGPSGPARPQQAAPVAEKSNKKVKANQPSENPDEDTCTEAPSKPVPVTRPSEIEYTQDARANNVEGRLVLKIVIGADGAVADVVVEKSVDPSLDAAAVAAVKTWTFKPAIRCGKGVAGGIFRLAKTFELGD
jgi:protein TonB